MKRTAITAALALVGIVLTVAACGGTSSPASGPLSKSDYEKQVNTIGGELGDSMEELADLDLGTDPSAAVAQFGAVESALEEAANDMRAIEPPAEIAAEHAALVQAFEEFADGVATLEELAGSAAADPQAAAEIAMKMIDVMDTADFTGAIEALQAKGYEIA